MTLATPIDIERFRQPLAAESPSGKNLRLPDDPATYKLWDDLKSLRTEARRIEKKADEGEPDRTWTSALSKWKDIHDAALAILAGTSYDLYVVQYLIEALVRLEGFEGLATGFDVARTLVEAHWGSLFPVPDLEDGQVDGDELRALPLMQLCGSDSLLEQALLRVPLTGTAAAGGQGLMDYRASRTHVDSSKLEIFKEALTKTPADRVRAWFQAASGAAEHADALQKAVQAATNGRFQVQTGALEQLLEEARRVATEHANDVVRPLIEAQQPASGSPTTPADAGAQVGTARPPLATGPTTREDALAFLIKAAEYFEGSDRHSLIGAHIRRTVTLANMSRERFYRELITESSALEQLGRIVGLSFEDKTSSGEATTR